MTRVLALTVLSALLAGCGPAAGPSSTPPAAASTNPPAVSTAETLINGFTGKTAVDAGKRAKATLEAVHKKEQHDVEEALQP